MAEYVSGSRLKATGEHWIAARRTDPLTQTEIVVTARGNDVDKSSETRHGSLVSMVQFRATTCVQTPAAYGQIVAALIENGKCHAARIARSIYCENSLLRLLHDDTMDRGRVSDERHWPLLCCFHVDQAHSAIV